MATNCRHENGKNYSIGCKISNNKPTIQFEMENHYSHSTNRYDMESLEVAVIEHGCNY